VLGFLGKMFQAGAEGISRPLVLSLLAAVVLPAVILLLLWTHLGSQTPAVAYVSRAYQCQWEHGCDPVSSGSAVAAGRPLRLKKGLLEVTFSDGTEILLEGPAVFEPIGSRRGFLYAGRLVADVPKRSIGFTVATPEAEVVDLGTSFGVSVVPGEAVEAHVFEGKIEVAVIGTPTDAPPAKKRLRANQAARVLTAANAEASPRLQVIDAAPTRFTQRLPEALPQPVVHFAHRGSANPQTEGWNIYRASPAKLRAKTTMATPVEDNGTAAWAIRSQLAKNPLVYRIRGREGLTKSLVAEAKAKGWVLRVRFKVTGDEPRMYLGHFAYG
jgi:hypothetical protein